MEDQIHGAYFFRIILTAAIFFCVSKAQKRNCENIPVGLENRYIIPDSSFTASSQLDTTYQPSNGRLNADYGWAPKTNGDPNDYLAIVLGYPYYLCAIATQGNANPLNNEWVTKYAINMTTHDQGIVYKVLAGNTKNNGTAKQIINQPMVKSIRIIPITYNRWKTIRVELYGYKEGCHNLPLGMESGVIQDGSISASSALYPAINARLYNTSGSSWCASTSDSSPYLQIDLGTPHLICAVATQGNSITDQLVKTYQINTSSNGTIWTTYQENNITRTFYGNYDSNEAVRNVFTHGAITRYLRIVPKTYQGGTPCLRTEIYGHPFQPGCSSHSVGIPSSILVPDHRFTATSEYDYQNCCSPSQGRMGAQPGWLPATRTAPDYLQIDIGDVFYICAVAAKAARFAEIMWVTRYKVLYSTNNKAWTTYLNESGSEHEFSGNSDITTVVTNSITNPFIAKFVRVYPTAYYNRRLITIDFKGLPSGCAASLGLENSQIPDSQMASSSTSSSSHPASLGRLYGSSSWCSSTPSNATEYIEVDLGQTKTVTGIATQGDSSLNKWVTSYTVSYSFHDRIWNEYKEGNATKTFTANNNSNDVIVNWLTHPFDANYVRIIPQNSSGGQCLRLDLYGCKISAKEVLPFVLPTINGTTRILSCSVRGEPTPGGIQWFQNETKINGATQPTLQIQFISAEDVVSKYNCTRQDPSTRAVICTKFYTCNATGLTWKVIVNLNVPGTPVFTTLIEVNDSILVGWSPLSPSEDVGPFYYILQVSKHHSLTNYSVPASKTTISLKLQRPYIEYKVRISAISSVGQGFWSDRNSIEDVYDCFHAAIGLENEYVIPNSSFTASSYFNDLYLPFHSRLNHEYGWAPKTIDDPNDYLQINLGYPYFVCAIATQGAGTGDQWVTEYTITTTTYQGKTEAKEGLTGNTVNNTFVKHIINQSMVINIRIIPTKYNGWKGIRVEAYGYREGCHNFPLGMESGVIQDGSITASSAQYPAMNARLYYTSGSSWCASTSDSGPYLQIDLGSSHLICAVATQGNSITDQWVKTYQINTSSNGITWTTYQENNISRTFHGNFNRTAVARRLLYHGVITRYLRIVPKTYQGGTPCLRTEIYGYPFQPDCNNGQSVGIPSSSLVPYHRFTATTYHVPYFPFKGRLGVNLSAWQPDTTTDDSDYLQIDLGSVFYVCSVLTQGTGNIDNAEWSTNYSVHYSTDNVLWNFFKGFKGNKDRTTVVTNSFTNPFKAKFIRVYPTDYHRFKALRVDFKGILSSCASPLGIESALIPKSQMTSSSSSDIQHIASRGRLYGDWSWCSSTPSNTTEYIQADLGQITRVTGIATQGDNSLNKWVTSYTVNYSNDNEDWNEYKEGNVTKFFSGNTNDDQVVVNWLDYPIEAQYVQIRPQRSYRGYHCLRFDLYGCTNRHPERSFNGYIRTVVGKLGGGDEDTTGPTVGGVFGFLFIAATVAVVAFLYRRGQLPFFRNNNREDNRTTEVVRLSGPATELDYSCKPILATKFLDYIRSMKETDYAQLKEEYHRLNSMTADYAGEDCEVGRAEENTSKNRYRNVVPLDRTRVHLKRENAQEMADYINASFIDTFRTNNAFILTQAPLQNTIEDFWIMVVNYHIRTIAMLNSLQEENEQFPQYWPQEGSETHGDVTVELLDTRDNGDVIARSLQVSYRSSSISVQHLQHLKWPDKSIPANPQTVLDLLNEVEQSQRQSNSTTPVVVQCSNGASRSGTLCAMFLILETIREEKVIDVFDAVLHIRSNRPGAVESSAQYIFCYKIIQKWMESN